MKNMIKNIVLSIVQLCCVCAVFGQTDINGIYYDDTGHCIELFNGSFEMVYNKVGCMDRRKESYAKALYFRESDNIIRLQHVRPDSVVSETMTVIQLHDNNQEDSISIHFQIPQICSTNLNIGVWCILSEQEWELDNWRYFCSTYHNGHQIDSILLPMQTKKIGFTILPEKLQIIPIDSISGFYNSFTKFDSHLIVIEKGMNRIEIIIPNLDDGYFGRYYVNGDYVRIDGDKLYWRGRVFEKRYRPEDIR